MRKENINKCHSQFCRPQDSGLSRILSCCNDSIKAVILNLIQDLQRLLCLLCKGARGRCQIQFGMTPLLNKGAFTLIELLVIVLIIGILAAVALPQYQKAVRKANLAQVVSVFATLSKAIDIYLLENGYPEDTRVWFTGAKDGTKQILIRPPWKSCDSDKSCFTADDGSKWYAHCSETGCGIYLWDSPLFSPVSSLALLKNAEDSFWLFRASHTSGHKEVCQFIRDNYGIDKMDTDLQATCARKGIL